MISAFIGVDEAGRGALAGPVVAAAVILDEAHIPDGITDSKQLSAAQRTTLAAEIKQHARAWSVAFIHHERIDEVNILQATFDAMHAAIDAVLSEHRDLAPSHMSLLIDGNRFRPHTLPHECIVHGDALRVEIGAASILAKVARDAWMAGEAETRYPHYGFAQHKGYGTKNHREAILHHGPCELHRHTFLKKILAETIEADHA